MIALLGDATRLADLALALPKEYEATIRFGETTETLDPESPVLERVDPGSEAPDSLGATLAEFVGEIEQSPPAYSAIKVSGTPAYRLARAGQAPELRPRRVTIAEIAEILPEERADEPGSAPSWPDVRVRIRCGAGTYIRSLARDIGAKLGLPAYLVALRRTAIGPFRADQGWALDPRASISLEDVAAHRLDPVRLLEAARIPTVIAAGPEALRVARGNAVDLGAATATGLGVSDTDGEPVGILGAPGEVLDGELIGIGRLDPTGALRPKIVFSGARETLEESITIQRPDEVEGP